MKIVCDFCKTEYNLEHRPNTAVKCAVCGHVWTPRVPFRQNATMKLIASVCALIAACIFSLIVVLNISSKGASNKPLIPKIDEKNIHLVEDETGNKRIFVSGELWNCILCPTPKRIVS